MSQQAGYSPSFKRPAEIMRMRRKRAGSDAGVFSSPSGQATTGSPAQSDSPQVRPFSPGPLFINQNRSGGGKKRRNPFANIENTYSPKKKLLIYNDEGKAEAGSSHNTEKTTDKEGEEDMSSKNESQAVLPFSARLMEAERQERQGFSSKVGKSVYMCRKTGTTHSCMAYSYNKLWVDTTVSFH